MNVMAPVPVAIRPVREWPLAARIALREVRGGLGALRLLFICLLLGVLAMAGVGSLATSIGKGLQEQGQSILGADVEARLTQRAPTQEELATLDGFGGTRSLIFHTVEKSGPSFPHRGKLFSTVWKKREGSTGPRGSW